MFLVDLDLPGMSGLDFIGLIEAAGQTVFPVLITSADRERVDDLQKERGVAYMQKPVDVNRLFSLINERSIN